MRRRTGRGAGGHRKLEKFAARIELIAPGAKREAAGWYVWGNEVEAIPQAAE